jgi:hypothetical protein
MKSGVCFENVQLREYHVFSESRDEVDRILLPDRQALLDEWNEGFLSRIEKVIEDNPGSLILVIAGLWHKYCLWNRLRGRQDIMVVHNLQS